YRTRLNGLGRLVAIRGLFVVGLPHRRQIGAFWDARETHNEKTPNGYKPAKPVKARSVSIKNNKNKGMDLGG
ncbi:hypothetical protein, partial [Aeromonas caviae]|uniref:hypothetical protein n=1 Tax=Aeromonas caviae TaxID=648 RepID=UPI001CC76F9C